MVSRKVNLSKEDFSASVSKSVNNLFEDQEFTDVTLVCEDNQQIKAHKVILSANSDFFRTVLTVNRHQHPLIYLKGIPKERLKQVIEFIYIGETNVEEIDVNSFLELGKDLKIAGLIDEYEHQQGREVQEPTLNKEGAADLDLKLELDKDTLIEETSKDFVESEATSGGITTNKHFKTNDETKVSSPTSMENRQIEESEREKIKKLLAKYSKKEISADAMDKKFVCTKCDYASAYQICFKKHILSKHEGIRYQCQQCDKSYSDSGPLWRHKKTVHEGFIHRCDICEKEFAEPSAHYRHKKMHSLNDKSKML